MTALISVGATIVADQNSKADVGRLLAELKANSAISSAMSTITGSEASSSYTFGSPAQTRSTVHLCKAGYDQEVLGLFVEPTVCYRACLEPKKWLPLSCAVMRRRSQRLPDYPEYVNDMPVSLIGSLSCQAGFYGQRSEDDKSLSAVIMTIPVGRRCIVSKGEVPSLMSFPGRTIQSLAIGAPFAKYIYGYRIETTAGLSTVPQTEHSVLNKCLSFVGEHKYGRPRSPTTTI